MITPQDKYISIRGLNLHYVDWGNSHLQPMVLVHGLQDCARCWDLFASSVRQWHHVLALDHRGHGDSQWATGGNYGLMDYVGELGEFLETLSLENVVLIGHSAGGKNSWICAAAHPKRLKQLVIADMDPDAQNPGSASMFVRYRTESDTWDSLEAVVERLRLREPKASEEVLRHHALHLTREAGEGKRAWKRDRALVLNYQRPDAWEGLRRIQCPTLIVRGAQSPLLTHPVAQRMQESIPNARLVELAGVGHWCYDEDPHGFLRAVLRFLGKG